MNPVEIMQLTNVFMKRLSGTIADPLVEAMLLANAMDWAEQNQIRFVWFMEDAYGRTNNGLSLVNAQGKVFHNVILGYDDEEDKLLMEALTAQEAMHMEPEYD